MSAVLASIVFLLGFVGLLDKVRQGHIHGSAPLQRHWHAGLHMGNRTRSEFGAVGTKAKGPSTPAPTQPIAIDPFLRVARTQPIPTLTGTLAAGAAGGTSAAFLTWNPADIPEIPAWASAIDLHISLPVDMTLPAGATATISPYAPYSGFSMQMLLAGSPEWPANMSLVPFWLDEITNDTRLDPFSTGPCMSAGSTGTPKDIPLWFDKGPLPVGFDTGATTVLPGATVNNAGTAAAHTKFVMQWCSRIRLQRKRSKMWGMVPLGDPQNRPQLKLQLNALVGPQPENNLIQDVAAAGITAVVDVGGVTCYAVFRSKQLDILPTLVAKMLQPRVGLGLNVTYDNSFSIQNAGAILYQFQRTAQIYTAIHHLFVNNKQAIDPDYFALWLTQNQQSARWAFDAAAGNMQDYYDKLLRQYGRYLPKGYMVADFEAGELPEIPRETPYNGLMSPDLAYAAAAGVAPTPNMSTAFRIPSGTSMSGAYVGIYTFGLVRVPY